MEWKILVNSNGDRKFTLASNKKLLSILLTIAFIPASNVLAELLVKTWNQRNIFNGAGQEIEVTTRMKAVLTGQNYYYDNWSISFDEESKVSIIEAKVLGNGHFESSFGGNKLDFKFEKIFNLQEIEIKFRYQLDNDEIQKIPYIRRESVDIPKFARGAKANLEVQVPTNMTLYSLNYLFSRDSEVFRWNGTIGSSGFHDTFAMTREKAKWKVSTDIEIEDSMGIKNLTIRMPLNYVGGNNEILEYSASNGQMDYIDGNLIRITDDGVEFRFKNFNSKKSFARLEAILLNSYNSFDWENNFDFSTTTEIGKSDSSYLSSVVNEIDSGSNGTDLPIYIRIAEWVHSNMTYDDRLVGVRMTSRDILKIKRGVCEHYAILYQDLLRAINIPSKTISGLSYNFEKKHFENHAWVMVYHNSTWIPIDPTWGIYSGKLPISHIFVYNDIRNTINYSRNGSLNNLKTKIKHSVEFLGE
ncbi:MAG: transglutaminase-like domain-containing protein [Rickettsiales bacterium]|jgi:hypothetical protein|nr:transglutaminase-like domain-containing protein [Rickettsiales bacterium]